MAAHEILHGLEEKMARVTGLEPATSGVTGRHSNQLSYTRIHFKQSGGFRFLTEAGSPLR